LVSIRKALRTAVSEASGSWEQRPQKVLILLRDSDQQSWGKVASMDRILLLLVLFLPSVISTTKTSPD